MSRESNTPRETGRQGHGEQPAPMHGWPAVLRPKALARHRLRPAVGALAATAVAAFIYRGQPEAGFAILAVIGVAAGWLLFGRVSTLICSAEVVVILACLRLGIAPWPVALVHTAVVVSLTGLAHLAADGFAMDGTSADHERRLAGLTFLLETAESLAGAADRDVVLNTAVRATAQGVSRAGNNLPSHASFHEVVGQQAKVVVVGNDPAEQEIATGFEYPVERNQAARMAIHAGRPAFVRPDHLSGPLRELADRLGWHVLIMAPVYSGGSLQGLLAATARDHPAVDRFQQYMLRTLARLTSLSLDSAAARNQVLSGAGKPDAIEPPLPSLFPGVVAALRDAVQPIKDRILQAPASENGSTRRADDATRAVGKLDDLITSLASRAATDPTTGLLGRELGLAALERDVLRARRTQTGRHCLALLRVATPAAANGSELIRLVADRLRSRLRREDLIFRYAEDEFVCSFADMDSDDAEPILKRIQTELAHELGYTPFVVGLTSLSRNEPIGDRPADQIQVARYNSA